MICTCPENSHPEMHGHLPECPLMTGIAEAETGEVELIGWQTPLHEELTKLVGRSVVLHVGPGMACQGKLESYDDVRGVCFVSDGRDNQYVRTDAILIAVERAR